MMRFLLLDNIFASLAFGVVIWFAVIGMFPHVPNACLDADASFQRAMGEQLVNSFAIAGAAATIYGVLRGVIVGRKTA